MPADDKLDDARQLAGEILTSSPEEVARRFYAEMKQRKLGKLVHRLDRLMQEGGEDARVAAAALERLGFTAETR